MGFDPFLLILGLVVVFLIVQLFLGNRRRKREAEATEQKMVVGSGVMTGSGIYGTIVELLRDENDIVQKIVIATAPGTDQTLTLHRQAVSRYLDPTDPPFGIAAPVVDEAPADEQTEVEAAEPSTGATLNGEPIADDATETPKPKRAPRKKPTGDTEA